MADLGALRDFLTAMPTGTLLSPLGVLEWLDQHDMDAPAAVSLGGPEAAQVAPWRERLRTAPADTRLTVEEVCEALGKKKAFVYKAVYNDDDPLPGKKFAGEWRFRVGDVIAWYARNERAP